MRRSICVSEPNHGFVKQAGTWKFAYTTATALPKETRLLFEIQTRGRPMDWEVPSTNPKEKKNAIWLQLPNGKTVASKEVLKKNAITPDFEFVLPTEVKAAETITIVLGKENRAQLYTQRKRPFFLYVDPKGKGDYKEPELFTLDVRGGPLTNIRVIAPSIVAKNERFDVLLRCEDAFGNLTNNAPEGTLIEVTYENLRENLNWKLFVPETGFLNIPNLYFNEPGMYRIQLRNAQSGKTYFSAPIKCLQETAQHLFWGILHGESERVDGAEQIDACLRYFRDEKNVHFYGISPFESTDEMPTEMWKHVSTNVAEANEDMRFATFLGFQVMADEPGLGVRHLVYAKDNKPILRKKEHKYSSFQKMYKSHQPKELLSIPCFTMGKGYDKAFEEFSPEYERVVEIYNAWGSSECTEKEGNLRPIKTKSKSGIHESEKGSIRHALNQNYRFGFIAGGLDDRGVYDGLYTSDQVQYSPGLTAVLAKDHTREALFHALQQRACYATTGERIIMLYAIAGSSMGTELNTKAKPGLLYNRHIAGSVAGTSKIAEITIIRNGKLLHTFHPDASYYAFAFDDTDPLERVAFPKTEEKPPFAYYYIRVLQEDGHIAWGSPIWIDLTETGVILNAPRKAKKK